MALKNDPKKSFLQNEKVNLIFHIILKFKNELLYIVEY